MFRIDSRVKVPTLIEPSLLQCVYTSDRQFTLPNFSFFFLFLSFSFYYCMCVLLACMFVHYMYIWCLWKQKRVLDPLN